MGPSKRRILLSRVAVAILLVTQISFSKPWPAEVWYAFVVESLGIVLIAIAALGRIWCSLFISGLKTHTLVVEGPYSMVRNPLYFFSFLGVIGAGLCSKNFLTLTTVVVLFIYYYPKVVKAEEVKLQAIHGDSFSEYKEKVPRFIPNASLYSCPEMIPIDTRRVRKAFLDGLAFLSIYPFFELLEWFKF